MLSIQITLRTKFRNIPKNYTRNGVSESGNDLWLCSTKVIPYVMLPKRNVPSVFASYLFLRCSDADCM
jgi:hypothetical protein